MAVDQGVNFTFGWGLCVTLGAIGGLKVGTCEDVGVEVTALGVVDFPTPLPFFMGVTIRKKI